MHSSFYDALPRVLRPDNPRTIVIKNNKDSLVLNAMLRDFELYYGVVIVPAPLRKPEGKVLWNMPLNGLSRIFCQD